MNKSLFQFDKPLLEKMYQRHRIESYLIYEKFIAANLLSYALVRFVSSLFEENAQTMYSEIGFLSYSLLLAILAFRGSADKVKAAFTLTNNLFCLLQIYANHYSSQQRLYLNGQNIMVFNLLFYYFVSLSEAPFQILLFVATRVGIQGYINAQFVVQQLFEQILTALCILSFVYLADRAQRRQFLLSFSEKQWEQSLKQLIQSPFIMFTYDKERVTFNLKLQNKMEQICWDETKTGSENLRTFLRVYKNSPELNIEQYIVHQMKARVNTSVNQVLRQQFRIRRADGNADLKKMLITLSEFYLNQDVYLIVFDQHEQKVKGLEKLKNALIHGINQHQQLTLHFLRKQMSLIQLSINGSQLQQNLHKLKIHCMYFIGKYIQINSFQEVENQITTFNFTGLLKQLIQTYELAYNQFSIELTSNFSQDIIMTSNENLVTIFFIIIFQTLIRIGKTNSTIIIHQELLIEREHPQVMISIIFRQAQDFVRILSNNQIFAKIQVRISPSSQIKWRNEAARFLLYLDLTKLNDLRILEEEIE